jgi:hypothetical protein
MEYLGAGRPDVARQRRAARPWAPILGAAITFVVVLVVGAFVVDRVESNVEMRLLVSQIEVSERAMADTQIDVANAIEAFRASDQPTAEDQTAFETALRAAAAKGLTGVTQGGDQVAAVRIVPWHSDIKAAQSAYLDHNHAWQAYLGKAAKDAAEFAHKQDAVNSTFAAAEEPLRNAVPSPDLFDLALRVNVIYAADPAAEDGSGQQA